jgi:dTDP-4-dehydrorhamnose reductase
MLGHQVYKFLKADKNLRVVGTCREPDNNIQKAMYGQFFPVIDALSDNLIKDLMDLCVAHGPFHYIINCIGIIKPAINEDNHRSVVDAIRINSTMPHIVAYIAECINAKVIHPSTDCVFSGKKKMPYLETDLPDATDIYGRTKVLGECPSSMNIRTSIIGPEMHTQRSLLEWYLSQTEEVSGFINHHWNGMTTLQWSRIVFNIIKMDRWKPGIQHMYSMPVTKENLLWAIKKEFVRAGIETVEIKPAKAPKEKWMTLKTNSPVYAMGFTIPHIIDQLRELVQARYGG